MAALVPSAHLQVPDGWEVTLELRLVGPASEGLKAPMALKSSGGGLQPGVTMTRRAAEPTTAKVMLNAFLKNLSAGVPGLQTLSKGPLRFADGTDGEAATVQYELEPGAGVVQQHVYRIDDGILTHLVATVAEREQAAMAKLLPILASFRP